MKQSAVAFALAIFALCLLTPTPASAEQALTPGVPVAGTFAAAGDEKRYEVTVGAGQHLAVILDGEDNYNDYNLYIKYGALPTGPDYSDADDASVTSLADEAVEIASTQAGTYYIVARTSYGTGPFSLVAHTASTFPTLAAGTPQAGTLQAQHDVKYYQVTPGAGHHLSVILDGGANYNTYDLYIKYGALPTTIDYDDAGEAAHADEAVKIASTQAGTYYIMIRSTYGGGSYSVVAHTTQTFPSLTIGTPRSGTFQAQYDVKYYQVAVAAGQHLSVILDGDANYNDYDIAIKYGALPTTIDYDASSAVDHADEAVEIPATQAGVYYVMISSAYGGGGYSLVAHTAGTFPGLTIGTPRSGSLQAQYDVKYFQVVATAGQRLSVMLDGSHNYNDYDLYIRYGALPSVASYDVMAAVDHADEAVEVASTQAGAYYVMVRSAYGGGAFSVVAHTSGTFPTLAIGTGRSGSLQAQYDVKYHRVVVGAGQHLSVILDGTDNYNNYDLYIRFGALPTTTSYDDMSETQWTDEAVEIASTQNGAYYIMIRSGYGGGAYSVVAHTGSTFPTLSSNVPRSGTLQAQYDVKYYQVVARAGDRLTVTLDGAAAYNNYDLYVRHGALPTTAEYDAKSDSQGPDEAVEIDPAQAATYYIMIRSGYGGGAFQVTANLHRAGIWLPITLRES